MAENIIQRDAQGHWLPGQSANPGGLPVGVGEVRRWAQGVWNEHGRDALLKLALHARREEVRLRAWQEILDRAYGRSPQALIHTGAEGGPLAFEPQGALIARLTELIGDRGEPDALPAIAPALVPGGDSTP